MASAAAPPIRTYLTPRDRRYLQLLADGFAYKDIAAELGIKIESVKTTMYFLRVRLGADTTAQAIAMAMRRQLIY